MIESDGLINDEGLFLLFFLFITLLIDAYYVKKNSLYTVCPCPALSSIIPFLASITLVAIQCPLH